ncbi:hypothetical protein nACB1_021 [Acinetobacter phage nACB1]|nr:hypothetical protein nACB1_021 [Acinetobacter phage nACB1]
MQVQIKRQVKIELDQADITAAVRNFLSDNGYTINEEDLAKINFVKSPKDGLRAELNITEETGVEEPEVTQVVETTPVEAAKAHIAEVGLEVVEPESEPAGEVATPSVEDVAVAEAVERALTPEVEAETEAEEVVAEAPRTKLFM